ncbi:hypothetical protein [Nonomuraea basaltis]|uniref:hypothetical protein n=1 Tax=Nonomuraea basaltis TaxID=2495887 RepID=UPI00110C44BD|nr:hypothetical protein [Nonomuraea basaltis]TMR90528.1 hypothetical protein EJK15_54785 [Nonomuraea basaltis]
MTNPTSYGDRADRIVDLTLIAAGDHLPGCPVANRARDLLTATTGQETADRLIAEARAVLTEQRA